MQKIDDLRVEIFSFEDEIALLQHELAAAGGRTGWLSGCVQGGPCALVRLSLAELRRWVGRLLFPRFWSLDLIFHWSFWRRHHQALARYHHYRKRSQAP
jgi:hypothetical protein